MVRFTYKVCHAAVERARHFDQPGEADAVRPAVVLLDLLEGDPDCSRKRCLRHAENSPPLPYIEAHGDVQVIGGLRIEGFLHRAFCLKF